MTANVFSRREELANAITHGVGALMAVAALVLLIVFSAINGSVWHVTSFTIFGTALTILYVMSTLYHSVSCGGLKKLFRKFDHIAIYVLIAGTYTPFCLTVLRGWVGWTLLSAVWFFAIAGVIVKAFSTGRNELLSTFLYLSMGWMVILAIQPIYQNMSSSGFILLIGGGCCYSLGAFFFLKDSIKYYHSIWHLFVMGGSVLHFFAVLSLL